MEIEEFGIDEFGKEIVSIEEFRIVEFGINPKKFQKKIEFIFLIILISQEPTWDLFGPHRCKKYFKTDVTSIFIINLSVLSSTLRISKMLLNYFGFKELF